MSVTIYIIERWIIRATFFANKLVYRSDLVVYYCPFFNYYFFKKFKKLNQSFDWVLFSGYYSISVHRATGGDLMKTKFR